MLPTSASSTPPPVGATGPDTAAAGTDPPQHAEDRFAIPLGSAGGFENIAAALTRKLTGLATLTHKGAVFLSVVGRPARFTQCLVDIDLGAWVECVSNRYLIGDERLTPAQERLLIDLGYQPPNDTESPNFWEILDQPVDWGAVAMLLVAPFVTVFPCDDDEPVELVVSRTFEKRVAGDLASGNAVTREIDPIDDGDDSASEDGSDTDHRRGPPADAGHAPDESGAGKW